MQRLDTEEFKINFKTLINNVRATHGENVPIVFVLSMMRDNYGLYIRNVISSEGGEAAGLYYITLDPDSYGGASHPSGDAHDDAADEIADFLKKKNLCKIMSK